MDFTSIDENTYKYQEVKEYFYNWIKENKITHTDDWVEIHHQAFNTDYYIIGTDKAKKWIGEEAFNIIGMIKDYEEFNFGKVSTDISDPEKVVNMYVYMIGEDIVCRWDYYERFGKTKAS